MNFEYCLCRRLTFKSVAPSVFRGFSTEAELGVGVEGIFLLLSDYNRLRLVPPGAFLTILFAEQSTVRVLYRMLAATFFRVPPRPHRSHVRVR